MEAEAPLNVNSFLAGTGVKIPDYMKNIPEELAATLLSIDEFKDKKKLIPYFAQYEF